MIEVEGSNCDERPKNVKVLLKSSTFVIEEEIGKVLLRPKMSIAGSLY